MGLLVLLSVSGLLLFTTYTFVQAHDQALSPTAAILVLFSLVPGGWALWSLESQRRSRAALSWLHSMADFFGVDPTLAIAYPLTPILAMAAWLIAGDKAHVQFPWLTAVLWAGALVMVTLPALVEARRRNQGLGLDRRQLALVAGLFVVAFILRAYRAEDIPWLLTGDEGAAGMYAAEFARGVWNNPFTVGWFSFPALYFVIPGAAIRLLGQTTTALRVPSALAGTLTVVALYGYARAAFGHRLAVIASVFLAVFHFHIHFSRIGLNNVWDPLFYVLAAGSLWRAWDQNRPAQYVWAGLAIGLSLYFYASSRALPVMLVLWLAVALLKDRQAVRRRIPGLLVLLAGFCAVALPLVLYFIRNPMEFRAPISRVGYLSNWVQGLAQGDYASVFPPFFQQLRASLLAFTSLDLSALYQPARPMLFPLEATLFSLGVVLILTRIKDLRYLWLVLWLGSGVLASTLSHGAPASQRFVFVAPVVALLVGLPLDLAYKWLRDFWEMPARRATGAVALVLLISIVQNLSFYFLEYSPNHTFGDPNTEAANILADYLDDWPAGTNVYFLASYMGFHSHRNVPYLAPHVHGTDIIEPVGANLDLNVTGHTLFVAPRNRVDELDLIKEFYPSGTDRTFRGDNGEPLLFSYALRPN